jgi:hypothetical protein
MKKSVALWMFCLSVCLFAAGCVATVSLPPGEPVVAVEAPVAQVEVGVPPPLDVQDPELVVVPSGDQPVYMVPDVAGVYFYNGVWYRNYNGAWFTAGVYNAPWVSVGFAPPVVVAIDPFYPFYLPVGYYRIGYWDFHDHWRSWGHDHWNRHGWYRHEGRNDIRTMRNKQIRSDRSKGIDRSKRGSMQKSGNVQQKRQQQLNKTQQQQKRQQLNKTQQQQKRQQLNKTQQQQKRQQLNKTQQQKRTMQQQKRTQQAKPQSKPQSRGGGGHDHKK